MVTYFELDEQLLAERKEAGALAYFYWDGTEWVEDGTVARHVHGMGGGGWAVKLAPAVARLRLSQRGMPRLP
jgi:hypothetical protein